MTPREIARNYVAELKKQQDLDVYPYYIDNDLNENKIQKFISNENKLNKPNIIGIYNKETNKNEYFLIDITYNIFFENENFKNYMLNHHYEFANELLNNGFIEFNKENFHYYLDGFLNMEKDSNNILILKECILNFNRIKRRKKNK